ncbi:ABC transporter ATP-binding protein [Sporolactobacillus shoreicorticis]|uniref:ABC transporter ATP-binding protein n=1 Tax=Sporolactobacillus shoreicorticis TaxID=1923877 RepID=A0ABW5S2I1_9BACL|nr:ABC transporter ATP-binding protein [Sporolactobacillus shoreicorticis]MCO7127998.1 ABC transporter ATP-binding protein [Sporolactobacillus shoreicorticis]
MVVPVCELINIDKSFGKHHVLHQESFKVNIGEMVALTGKSGVGKSTLLNIIGLLEKPDRGSINLLGSPAPNPGSAKVNKMRRNHLAYLFQNYALVDHASIDDNLTIALTYSRKSIKEKEQMKRQSLEKVGLDLSLKQKIYELSGGEQQRVALARVFLKPFDLLLADEPTGSLDEENRDHVLRILTEFKKRLGKTIIIVTHDPHVAAVCDREVKLDGE